MMGVFAAAVARLTPTFVESFDPEQLASKFVRVEKEFGVKFTKSNSTFNIVGHWEAVRKAHKSLLKLNYNEKINENCSDVVDTKEVTAESSLSRRKCLSKKNTTKNLTNDRNNGEVTVTPENEQSTGKEPLFFRGKGNPKRGRQTAKESPYSGVPEPVFYLQYQDKTYTDACSLDIDSVLEDFEKSQHDKKVSKEDLKKILEKNKDQMGKPLEKGIPKGAILPVSKGAEDSCETFTVEDMLNPIPPSTQIPSDASLGHDFGMPASSFSFTSISQTALCSSGTINMEMGNQFNSSLITTYTVNAKMSTQNPGVMSSIDEVNNQGINAGGHLNISDFYNHTDVQNGQLGEGVFSDNHGNENGREQVQLSDTNSDSFSSMFEEYDPQAMLNQIPAPEVMTDISEVSDKRSHQVDSKLASSVEMFPENSKAENVNEDKERGVRNSEEMRTSFQPSNDPIQFENNREKMEMHDYKQGATVSFEQYTEGPVNCSTVIAKAFSSTELQGDETISAVVNSSSDIISMAIKAAQDNVDTLNPDSPTNQLSSCNTVVSSNQMIQTNAGHFLKSMPTGEEFMKSLEVTTATEDQSVLYSSNEQSVGPASFQNIAGVTEDNRSPVTMTAQVIGTTDLRGHPNTIDGNAVSGQSTGNKVGYNDNYGKATQVEKAFEGLVPECKGSLVSEVAVDTISNSINTDLPHITAENSSGREMNQEVTGKVLSPSKMKKSRSTGKRVKKKVSENSEKSKRERKPKSSSAGSTNEGILTARKHGCGSDGKDERTQTNTKTLELDSVKSDRSTDKEYMNKQLVTTEGKKKQIYKCTECDYQGFRKKRLSEHMGRVHGLLPNGTMPENPVFSCHECEKTFVFEKDLSRHKKIVHHGQVFICLVCNKNYKSKYVYDRHTATHVEGYVQPKFKCQICEQEFTTKFSLSSHIKSKHLGVKKTYSCPTCGKTFSQIRSYRQHANVHAGIRPYTCEVCGKSFTYDKSLKEHRYMHDTVRRFQCTVCQKAFRQQTCLLIHMKTHKEKKDHICSVCGREFTQKQSLLRHERIHTGDKPYSCKLCYKSFGDYAVIRKHIMMAHKAGKDGWKQFAFTAESKRSSHYIDGGPGYVPRESYAKINQKSEDDVQSVNLSQVSDDIDRRIQPGNEDIAPVNNFIPVQEIYQVPLYTSNLDFNVIANGSPSQEKHENMTMDVNRSAVTSLDPDIYGSINSQQQNITMKSYLSSINANTLTKIAESGEDKYAAQFQSTPDLVYNVAMEKSSSSAFAVKDELLSSSVPSGVSIATSDALTSGALVTMASTNISWTYPGYSSAYFSPSSFSPYQNSPDTSQ